MVVFWPPFSAISSYYCMYSIELYCVTKKWAPHWLHSASGAESRRYLRGKQSFACLFAFCIFICITLCAVVYSHMLYTLHMTPNRLLLTYLFNTSYNGFPCVIIDHCTFPCVNVNHWMIKVRPLSSKSKPCFWSCSIW